jgi:hypothetical protein
LFKNHYAHYLSYGATDQQTVVNLVDEFDGLMVPGTVAAFQREGTGGFVLSLSAANAPFNYLIDPRFPLFQQALVSPKKSHQYLAELLGDPTLVQSSQPVPSDFSRTRIEGIARAWNTFNTRYTTDAGDKFAKYARRLKEAPAESDARTPEAIVSPYFVSRGTSDPWWDLSVELFDASKSLATTNIPIIRVVAVNEVTALGVLLNSIEDEGVAIWVSGLNEIEASAGDLAAYLVAIRAAFARGTKTFALYGGFFSVLLHNVGLGGASHGIGYGENRQWLELPQSGPPPARYYVPQLHRYFQLDEATRLQSEDPRLAGCQCVECLDLPPDRLDYQALMRHSVYCRKVEIDEWSTIGLVEASRRLEQEFGEWQEVLGRSGLGSVVVNHAMRQTKHIEVWVRALSAVL